MAIELEVIGNGHFKGARSNIANYTVTEDSTPIDPNDTSGGVGQIDFDVIEDDDNGAILLINDTVMLTDQSNGKTTGTVTGISGNDGVASVTANSRLGLLLSTVQAQPFTGRLEDALLYYFELAGVTSGIVVDETIADRPVTYEGFYGVLWDNMRMLCAAQQIEISLISDNVVVRPLRTRTAEVNKDTQRSWSVQNVDLAQTIEVILHETTYVTNKIVYPAGGWNTDVEVFQVNAGEINEFDIDLGASLSSVKQPIYVSTVDRYYSGTESVYTAAGSDGLPITPAQWAADGGTFSLTINEDTHSLHAVITGPNEAKYSPYSIAVAAGPSDYYSALRIVGTGVVINKTTLSIPTSVDTDKAPTVVGATIDDPFITTYAEAYTAGMITAGAYARPQQVINFTSTVINRKGDKGDFNYPTFDDIGVEYGDLTFDAFATLMGNKTYDEFAADQYAKVKDNFDNQSFGNAVGARVPFRNAVYRIRNSSTTPADISYAAEEDSTFDDFKAVWGDLTYDDFADRMGNNTYEDFGVIPLWS
jgi:hypothetical protein